VKLPAIESPSAGSEVRWWAFASYACASFS
jgi:hypothetical protein